MDRLYKITLVALIILGFVNACTTQAGDYDFGKYGYEACEPGLVPMPMITPDVEPGYTAGANETKTTDTLNEKPPNRISYIGTTGYMGQEMRAIPDNNTCPMGAAIILSRPSYETDMKYNSDCCAPGMSFSSYEGTEISGSPTEPGTYEKTILLCGYCRGATGTYKYPVETRILWDIRGQKARRLE